MTDKVAIAPELLVQLTQLLPEVQRQPLVVKLGGSVMEVPSATQTMLESLLVLQRLQIPVIVVHGGGKPIDRAMALAGIEPLKIQGRRYTDDATLAIVVQVLSEINTQLVKQFQQLGGVGKGLSELDTFPIVGERLLLPGLDLNPLDLGRVGKVTAVKPEQFFGHAVNVQPISFVPSLAFSSEDGGWLNVNADTVAAGVAGAVSAKTVYFFTDTPGVMQDRNDPKSLANQLTVAQCRQWIDQRIIDGGMIPKVEACFEAITAGAERAVILDGRVPYSLLSELCVSSHSGTSIVS